MCLLLSLYYWLFSLQKRNNILCIFFAKRQLIVNCQRFSNSFDFLLSDGVVSCFFNVTPIYTYASFLPRRQLVKVYITREEQFILKANTLTFKHFGGIFYAHSFFSKHPVAMCIKCVSVSIFLSPQEIVLNSLQIRQRHKSAIKSRNLS